MRQEVGGTLAVAAHVGGGRVRASRQHRHPCAWHLCCYPSRPELRDGSDARMIRTDLHRLGRRLVRALLLAGPLALAPVSAPTDPPIAALPLGASTASAQGNMDIGILTPSFSDLPHSSLLPGETFNVGVSTAPGARCTGQVSFRDQPPIDLEEVAAPDGACSWSVTVPPTVRPSTGVIVIPITRSGQWWTLYGIVYVRPVGESR